MSTLLAAPLINNTTDDIITAGPEAHCRLFNHPIPSLPRLSVPSLSLSVSRSVAISERARVSHHGGEGGREGGRAAVSTLGNAIPRGERGDGRGRQGRESRNHNHVLLQKLVRSSVQENLVSILFSRKIIMYSNHKRKLSKG